ncbi:hypothetical protein SSPIM334S_05240 [Streptomyces spiroverticillatus]
MGRDKSRQGRLLLLVGLPFLVAAVAVAVTFVRLRGRLPDALATHFGAEGVPDGHTAWGVFLAVSLGLLVGGGVLFTVVCRAALKAPGGQRTTVAAGAASAVLLGWPVVAVLVANADTGARFGGRVAHFPFWQFAAALGGAVLVGAVVWLLAGAGAGEPVPEGDGPGEDAEGVPRLELADGETAGWTRVTGSRVLPAVGLATLALGAVVGLTTGWGPAVPVLVVGALLATVTGARVTVDRHGLTVSPVLLSRPRMNVPLDRIETAGHRQVSALGDFGGWGYRMRPGASGIVLRSGDAERP